MGRVGSNYHSIFYLPKHVFGAFLSAEDANFFKHRGFDATQIERSLGINLHRSKLLRGGSTISQQLTKNLFLSPKRNFARKFQEAILTWRLEKTLTKRQILERYLNVIQLGIGVYGITEGSKHWFNRKPHRLRIEEAAFLASITASPTTTSRRISERGELDPESREKVDIVLRNMYRNGYINKIQLAIALRSNVTIPIGRLATRTGMSHSTRH